MNFKHCILLAVIGYPFLLPGQNKYLFGSWVKTKVEMVQGDQTQAAKAMESRFIRYIFNEDGIAYKSTSQIDLGAKINYSIRGDVINWNFLKTKIETLTPTSLVVVELDGGKITDKSTRMYFSREEELMNKAVLTPNDFYVASSDTVFFEGDKVYVIFNNNEINLSTFLSRHLGSIGTGGEAFAYATFVINPDGKLSDVTIQHHVNKSFDEIFKKAILKTEGLWILPVLHGKKVKVLGEVKFSYFDEPTIDKTSRTVKFEHKIYFGDYEKNFIESTKQMIAGNCEKAIEGLAGSLRFTTDEANLNYLGSICFEKLNDIPNRNVCLEKVKASKFRYLLNSK